MWPAFLAILSTASALIAIGAAYFAATERARAAAEADRLRESRGRLIALEHSVVALDTRVKRATGALYSARSAARKRVLIDNDTGEMLPLDDDDDEFSATLKAQGNAAARSS